MLVAWIIALMVGVQAKVTSLEQCVYTSTNTGCTGTESCSDLCDEADTDCSTMTCDFSAITYSLFDVSFDTCLNFGFGYDTELTCTDDGESPCEDFDLCLKLCYVSNGYCNESCFELGDNIDGYTCDEYALEFDDMDNSAEWGECFSENGTDMIINCTKTSSSSGMDAGAVVGIAIGAIVVVFIIVCVVICMMNQNKQKAEVEIAGADIATTEGEGQTRM